MHLRRHKHDPPILWRMSFLGLGNSIQTMLASAWGFNEYNCIAIGAVSTVSENYLIK